MTVTMERSPEAARVAAAIRAAMEAQSLNGVELAERIERLTGVRKSEMWITRHIKGQVHLTRPKRVAEWAPVEDLELIAQALGVDADTLAAAANEPAPDTTSV